MKTQYYTAASLDGFLATTDHSLEWLFPLGDLEAGLAAWLPAQEHHGENIGETATHVIFVELKEGATPADASAVPLGPQ